MGQSASCSATASCQAQLRHERKGWLRVSTDVLADVDEPLRSERRGNRNARRTGGLRKSLVRLASYSTFLGSVFEISQQASSSQQLALFQNGIGHRGTGRTRAEPPQDRLLPGDEGQVLPRARLAGSRARGGFPDPDVTSSGRGMWLLSAEVDI